MLEALLSRMMLWMRFFMTSVLYGLEMKSEAPSCRHRISSVTVLDAVMTMTGRESYRGLRRLRSRNSKPLHSGM